MDRLVIDGGNPLHGRIVIGGAKNAALPLFAACLLSDEPLTLYNVPDLADIESMSKLLMSLGVRNFNLVRNFGGLHNATLMSANPAQKPNTCAPYDIVRIMRASILVLGPLLARYGMARVSMPGGCAIGDRPVNLHMEGLKALGADIKLESGNIVATAPGGRLRGGRFNFPLVTVTGTENIMMAATLAKGETVLTNAAKEPEVVDLAKCLVAMGAKITGAGTDAIHIEGVDHLHGAKHTVIADRIEAGTYAMAVAMTGGRIELMGIDAIGLLASPIAKLREAGVNIEITSTGFIVSRDPETRLRSVNIKTEPFPGFPTDLQAQFMALMTTADGTAMIQEEIFENRFMHVAELRRMGAKIEEDGRIATVTGIGGLQGAEVMSSDLRASAALVIAGLAATGQTIVNRIYHLDRGYERLVERMAECHANIWRIRNSGVTSKPMAQLG